MSKVVDSIALPDLTTHLKEAGLAKGRSDQGPGGANGEFERPACCTGSTPLLTKGTRSCCQGQ